MKAIKKIFGVKVCHKQDECADTSCLGKYTDELEAGVIVMKYGEFFEKLPEDAEIPERGREYRGFEPYAGGEEVGTEEYYEYGLQDYERMEGLVRGNWVFLGIIAEACVGVSLDGGKSYKLDTLTSGGVWGIESDSAREYLEDVGRDELADLKATLLAYGFGVKQVNAAIKNAETVDE